MDKIFELIEKEQHRQDTNIELIASENFVSKDILKATGSILTSFMMQNLLTSKLTLDLAQISLYTYLYLHLVKQS